MAYSVEHTVVDNPNDLSDDLETALNALSITTYHETRIFTLGREIHCATIYE